MTTRHWSGPAVPAVPETPPANLPIPPDPLITQEEAVRSRAYQLWEEAGRPEGDGVEFWLQAERELSGGGK